MIRLPFKAETNDVDSTTNKDYSIKGYSYEVPEKWEENMVEEIQFFYPEDAEMQVAYAEGDGSIEDEEALEAYFDRLSGGLDKYKVLEESEFEIDGMKAYQQDMEITMLGKEYVSTMVLFDHEDGMICFWMSTLEDSEKDYSKDFKKIIESISKPLAFERTIDDVDTVFKALTIDGEFDFVSPDFGEDDTLKNWSDVSKGIAITALADDSEKVTLISAVAKSETSFTETIVAVLIGMDVFSKDASELLSKVNPTALEKMGTEPDDAIIEVIEGVSYMIRKSDTGTYPYSFILQRDQKTRADYEEYVNSR